MATPKKRVREITAVEEKPVKVEIVTDYPDSYKRRLKRIELYGKALEFVKVRAVGYPVVIFDLMKSLFDSTKQKQSKIWEVTKEVYKRLMDGDLDPYPIMEYQGGEVVYPKKTARRIAVFIVSFHYSMKLGFKSKGLIMLPLLIAGLWGGNELLKSAGVAEGWEFGVFVWAGVVVFLGVTAVYGFFGYKKSPEFKGVKHKYHSWIAKKISDEDEEK